jgi:hypothetical protein
MLIGKRGGSCPPEATPIFSLQAVASLHTPARCINAEPFGPRLFARSQDGFQINKRATRHQKSSQGVC